MKNILKNCPTEYELIGRNHLKKVNKGDYKKFNIVIGKNGSGKSRFLRFLKDVAKRDTRSKIIFLDCTDNSESTEESSQNVSNKFIFNYNIDDITLTNLYPAFNKAAQQILESLADLCTNPALRGEAKNRLQRINDYLCKLLQRELIIQDNTIYLHNLQTEEDKEISQELPVLSPGEHNILVIALALLSIQLDETTPTLLLIDELEMHLHPAALLDLFRMLQKSIQNANCCVFIATHSIFLLPTFKFEEICYLNDGTLMKVDGKIYQDIVDALVLGENGERSILDFLASIEAWSYAQYIAECFEAPTLSDKISSRDQQYLKLKSLIYNMMEKNKKLDVLDYGSGEARIGMCMRLDYKETGVQPNIAYHIYDKYNISKEFKTGEFVFGTAFPNRVSVESQKGKMDIVLLFNVLHEIGVDEWKDELNLILSLLKEDGILVFSERKTLSIGEKPYGKSGYLLLGEDELRVLFENMQIDKLDMFEDKKDDQTRQQKDKTWGFAISKCSGKKITDNQIKLTLDKLEENTKKVIDSYLEQASGTFKARDYAFYCQQYINVQHARKIMNNATDEEVKKMSLQFILHSQLEHSKKCELIKKRAFFDDEEGRRCKKYLEEKAEEEK